MFCSVMGCSFVNVKIIVRIGDGHNMKCHHKRRQYSYPMCDEINPADNGIFPMILPAAASCGPSEMLAVEAHPPDSNSIHRAIESHRPNSLHPFHVLISSAGAPPHRRGPVG